MNVHSCSEILDYLIFLIKDLSEQETDQKL